MEPLKDGSIWEMPGKPLLARWTSDFDCGYETNWWYLIIDKPIVLEGLSRNSRRHIREGLKRCDIKKICSRDYAEALYECYHAAFSKYKNAANESSREQFIKDCENNTTNVYYAGFGKESNKLIGYFMIREDRNYAELSVAKFDPEYLNTHISDALYYMVINKYLLDDGMRYVSSGERSINHVTNTQEYIERTFGYRKAYCKLHIKYRWPVGVAVKILYPFRGCLKKFKNVGIIHQVMAVLKMEEVRRRQE